ncbi:MAG: DNA repair protein RecO [Candidatus Doudnabacteria bacterium RIFCSPLOWO2_02_FULL_49_13]|uniref:DNA repair protein RecO n=1 Tax=Candidatus Doudnabacteria bacterium RIFCSPHIGHO2_12_FULL_48_16 TaxID=1817838 RepID=A0A1F5PLI2_9BACT|nr:MAG: DNA repair protein RecO [Candidatus Doudnabacteria bacterium RIFCSPHIGHO2_02_FULL_49_24]OGE89660.1 MAG: DNA repair protein RecO [Candidatus Doudnabacteria bacterium RIFCSPHIGHO2_01_FULL_50_67]OGE90739.1 MAG: DNA repair protein RecO [Candidatus Doudnabacteria bacterium RIFCSPHIGHO2_12_FULL_48_16]OGE96851.1 MAG: DNA repair protein RecO [Candidatus Doudnabacteria bacterium RIFCSPLOWO2_01_FULL_49_40]OGF02602.1 MAG: DNA repair protein RecO [Candidatus Doudnabacteria bacterium RIFCSPLOWO2_02_
MKYKKLTGIILKKQNYREADQILTLWTKQAGKVRALARGVRLLKSKLNFCLADLGICEIDLAGHHGLATLIGVKSIRQFGSLREDLKKAAVAFYAAELMLKMTADEHPNEQAFELLKNFLQELDKAEQIHGHDLIDNFALNLAQDLGFGSPKQAQSHSAVVDFVESILDRHLKSEEFMLIIN